MDTNKHTFVLDKRTFCLQHHILRPVQVGGRQPRHRGESAVKFIYSIQETSDYVPTQPWTIATTEPSRNRGQRVIGCSMASEGFNLVRASLSQKLKLPSDPTVARVPCMG
ncbi:unnamed protein product [Timema podura]|uniref:Uncharacterized protein n=1 Tax=Timema podura TaxID=61482 RepID=A0ABN7P1V2_TIMPD|nr:unnamed protein product [Timema podura]